MSKALSFIDFTYSAQDIHFYGVLKPGVSQDQVFSILQSEPSTYDNVCRPLLDLLDSDYSFSNYIDFISYSQSEDCAVGYAVNFDNKSCAVKLVNGGQGGIAEDDLTSENSSFIVYYIPDYKSSVSDGVLYSIGSGSGAFFSRVLVPVGEFCASNSICLVFLAVTFLALGLRFLRRSIVSFGRGR